MRIFILILLIIFCIQSWSNADDISEFEIEGVSIGESLLKYMTKKEIISDFSFVYKDKEFATVFFSKKTKYDNIQITVKPNDKNLIIHGISAIIYYDDRYSECLIQKEIITKQMESLISSNTRKQSKDNIKRNLRYDPTGESIWSYFAFYFDNGEASQVFCTDWAKYLTEKKNWRDNLKVAVYSKQFASYLKNQ